MCGSKPMHSKPSSIHPQSHRLSPKVPVQIHCPPSMSTEASLNETSPQAVLATQVLLWPDLTPTPDTTLSQCQHSPGQGRHQRQAPV